MKSLRLQRTEIIKEINENDYDRNESIEETKDIDYSEEVYNLINKQIDEVKKYMKKFEWMKKNISFKIF